MRTLFYTLTLFLACLICNLANAQWQQVGFMVNGTDTVSGGNFRGYGANIYSATDKGLFMSADNGETWTNITTSTETSTQKFKSVFKAANGDLYAGSDLYLYKSANDGSSWTKINSLPDSLWYEDIAEAGNNIIVSYKKGAAYGVYYSSNNGASWNLATGLTSAVKHFFVDGNMVYLGGTSNGVYKSTDNSQSWSLISNGLTVPAGVWTIVKTGNNLLANSVGGKGVYISTDNGNNWTNTDTATFKGFCQVFALASGADGRVVATMDGACNGGVPVKTSTDNGVTWTGFMDGLPTGFYPNIGTNAGKTLFLTKKGTAVYRYGATVGIKNVDAANDLKIYPNPNNGSFNIVLPKTANKIVILNALGQLVQIQNVNSPSAEIELTGKGFYLVQVFTENDIFTKKILVK